MQDPAIRNVRFTSICDMQSLATNVRAKSKPAKLIGF
jgi:hypothetical protein